LAAPSFVGVGIGSIGARAGIRDANHHRLAVIITAVGAVQLLIVVVTDPGLIALHFIAGPASKTHFVSKLLSKPCRFVEGMTTTGCTAC
jgi:hypothetical protein